MAEQPPPPPAPPPAGKISCVYHAAAADAASVPLLASFNNGPPPANILNNSEDGIRFTYYRNSDARKARQRILAGDTEKHHYEGRNWGEGAPLDKSRYLVALYNRKDSKLDLYDASSIFRMDMKIKGVTSVLETTHDSVAEARRQAIENFGSKRKKGQMRTAQSEQVSANGLIAVEKTQAALAKSTSQSPYVEPPKARKEDLPPYNDTTDDVEQAYPFQKMVTQEELEVLRSNLPAIRSLDPDSEFASSKWPSYVLDKLRSEEPKKKQQLERLLYLTYLLRFFRMSWKKLGDPKRDTLADIPKSMMDTFVTRYTELVTEDGQSKITIPKLKLNLLKNTIFVLALLVSSFKIPDIANLVWDMNLTAKDCIQHFRALGAKVVNLSRVGEEGEKGQKRKADAKDGDADVVRYSASLSAPLKFAEVRLKRNAKAKQ